MADGYISEIKLPDNKTYLLKDNEKLPLSGGIMTGNIRRYYSEASTEPMITALSNNLDIYLWQVGHGGAAATNLGNNGYKLLYKGTNNSTNNYLQLIATKSDGTETIAAQWDELGNASYNGKAIFNLGSSSTTSADRKFIIQGASSNKVSIGSTGLQAYDSSNATSTLYLQYYGGTLEIGSTSTATAVRNLYGTFDFKSANGFTYSGIAAGTDNADRVVWFSYNGILGRPVYDNDFKYNPSTNTLKIGTGTLTATNYSGKAATAGTADKATADADNNTISTTYVKKVTSTDDAIARFNGDAGAIQDSKITIDDNGTMSFLAEQDINFRMNRKNASGGGWAHSYIKWYDSSDTIFAIVGMYGQNNTLDHLYIGPNTSYSSDLNLQIYNDGTIKGKLFSGSGASLTSLNGSNISSGTVAAARIDSAIARLASPDFTGTPTAPTAANGTNTTQIATTAFVNNTLAYVNAMQFKGTLGTGGTITALPATHNAGDTYRVITAGTWAGKYCEVGTLIICVKDGTAAADADWTSVETNEDGAVIGPSSSTENQIAKFSSATGRTITNSGITIDSSNNLTVPGTIYFSTGTSTTTGKPILAYNGNNTKFGIWYKEGSPDVMAFSASGNGDTTTSADFAIEGGGKLYNKGNIIPYTDADGSVGGTTTPVYVDGGQIKALSYTIAKSVPADAVFTDHYAWGDLTGKPIYFVNAAFGTTGWKQLNGRNSNISSIAVAKPTDTVTWGTVAHSAIIAWGNGDTKGMIDCSYSSPLVSIAGGNNSGSTDAAPKWYFKLSATSGQTYTFPSTSKTLAATDGSNASGSWGISITGSAGSVAWANTGHPDTFPPTIGTTATTAMAGNTTVTNVSYTSASDNAEYPILMKNSTSSTTTAAGTKFNTGVTINPSNQTITANEFIGNLKGNNIIPTMQKTYTGNYYGTGDNYDSTSFFFISLKPDTWYKPWKIKFKIRSYCPAHTECDSVTYGLYTGRLGSYSYANWNERNDSYAHYYTSVRTLNQTGFNASLSHALGICLRYASNYTNTGWPRTFEVEIYDYEGCTVSLLDAPLLWANWPNAANNYNGWSVPDAVTRGLCETNDATGNNDDRTLQDIMYFRFKSGAAGIGRYTLLMEESTGVYSSLTTTFPSSNTPLATLTMNTGVKYKLGRIIYFNQGVNRAGNTNIGNDNQYFTSYSLIDGRYTFQYAAGALTGYKPFYMVGTLDANGFFTIDPAATAWSQDLPTANTNKVYVFLGTVYPDTNAYRIALELDHPIYTFTDGALKQITPGNISGKAASVALSGVTGADDLKAIEALTGTSGLLKKTAANTWTLDTSSYVTSSGVTKVSTGAGLTGGDISSTGTVKANLTSETKLTNAAADGTETSGRVYPVRLDKNGKLAVNVPWTNVNSSYLPLTGGTLSGDLGLKSSSADSPDIVWWYGNTSKEQARIWMGSGRTTKWAPLYRCYNSEGTSLYSGNLVLGDGTGASGTWSISISGNATTATTATNLSAAPTISATGSNPTSLSANTTYTLTVGGKSLVFKTPSDANTNTLMNYTLGATTRAYLMGSQNAPTSTTTARAAHGDMGVYLTNIAGQLSAESFSINDGTTSASSVEKVWMQWNATDSALEFIFA